MGLLSSFKDKEDVSIFSADLVSQLSAIAINPAENFLSGKNTSALAKPVDTSENQEGNNESPSTLDSAQQMFKDSLATASSMAQVGIDAANALALTPQIVLAGTTMAGELFLSYGAEVATYVMKMPAYFIAYTAERTQFWFNENLEDETELLERVTKEYEGLEEEEEKMNEEVEETQEQITEKVSNKLEEVQKTFSKATGEIQKGCENISKYIQQGPEWLENQIQTYVYKGLDITQNYVGQQIDKLNNDVGNICEKIAKQQGKAAAEKVNKATEKALRQALENTNKNVVSQAQKVKTAASKAKLILKALL